MDRGDGLTRQLTASPLFWSSLLIVLPLKRVTAIIRFIGDRQRALMRKLRVKQK